MCKDRLELLNLELDKGKSNLRVIKVDNILGKKRKVERVTYECIECNHSDNITSKALKSGNGEASVKLCPVCQTFRKVSNWTIDKYINEKNIKIKRITDVFSAKDKFNYICLDCKYVTKDSTYDKLSRNNKSFCQCCKPTSCGKLTEDLFDARIKYRDKPYKRIGELVKKHNTKPGVKLKCDICDTVFECEDATYVSTSYHNQCPTCEKNNRILDNYNKIDNRFDTKNMSIKEKAKLSFDIVHNLEKEKELEVRKYLKLKNSKLITEFTSMYDEATIECKNCGTNKTYESLSTIYEVESLCKCQRYTTYKNKNNKDLGNELLKSSNYIDSFDDINKDKNKFIRPNYEIEGIIYVATNITNNHKYVGQTIQSLQRRKYSHEWDAMNNKDNNKFHNALVDHGLDKFEWNIIDKGSSRHELDEKEQLWIKRLNTWIYGDNPKGYNTDLGGNSGGGARGERNAKAKLTNKDVENIKEEFLASSVTVKELSDRFKVSESSIYRILNGTSFKEIRRDLNEEIFKKRINKPNYIIYWEMRYEKGMTDEEISGKTGKAVKHIQTIISQANSKLKKTKNRKTRKEQEEQREDIIRLYKEGRSIEDIVKLGYPKTTVKRNIDKVK